MHSCMNVLQSHIGYFTGEVNDVKSNFQLRNFGRILFARKTLRLCSLQYLKQICDFIISLYDY